MKDYASWCIQQPDTRDEATDPSSAVAVSFIEDIPLNQRISDDLHRGVSAKSFEGFENLFRYHLDDDEYQKFAADFHRKKKDSAARHVGDFLLTAYTSQERQTQNKRERLISSRAFGNLSDYGVYQLSLFRGVLKQFVLLDEVPGVRVAFRKCPTNLPSGSPTRSLSHHAHG